MKATYLVFAHKQMRTYKLAQGWMPLGVFFTLGGALIAYFAGEDFLIKPHIDIGLVLLGILGFQILHFWWPGDNLLPRRLWF